MMTATIPGNPGAARANARLAKTVVGHGKRRRVNVHRSDTAKAWRRLALPILRRAWAGRAPLEGPVVVELRAYWDRQRHLEGCEALALGDVDAPIKEVLDALELAGVILDDVQVRRVVAEKFFDRGNARIEVEVRPWTPAKGAEEA